MNRIPATLLATIFRDVPLPPERTLVDKLNDIHLPEKLAFRGVCFYEAMSYLRQEGCHLDTEEEDLACRGVPVWIGLQGGSPLVLGEPGESKELDRWVGWQRFTAAFPAGTCLGSAWQHLAEVFGLELRVHEEDGAGRLILWLPSAMAGGRLKDEAREKLAAGIERAKELLRQHGQWMVSRTQLQVAVCHVDL